MSKTIGTNKLGSTENLISAVHSNAKKTNRQANSYSDYARKLTERLSSAVKFDSDNMSEVEEHIERSASNILRQIAQGRHPFVTYRQVRKGQEIAGKKSVGNDRRSFNPRQAELAKRLCRLGDVMLAKVMTDVAQQIQGAVSQDDVESYLEKNINIGRVLAVAPAALYKAYTKAFKVSFVVLPQLKKALDHAETNEHLEVWQSVDEKLTEIHAIDMKASAKAGITVVEDRDEFMQLMDSDC